MLISFSVGDLVSCDDDVGIVVSCKRSKLSTELIYEVMWSKYPSNLRYLRHRDMNAFIKKI